MLDSRKNIKRSLPLTESPQSISKLFVLPPNYQETFTIAEDLKAQIRNQHYAITQGNSFQLTKLGQSALSNLQKCWDSLEYDPFYGEQEPTSYRSRRYTEFDFNPHTGELNPRPHVPYLQSPEMNHYAGGKARHFGDLSADTYQNPLFQDLVNYNFTLFPVNPEFLNLVTHLGQSWICQVHIMRIVVGAGKTTSITPEGIHSDGYPFAGLHLINKVNVRGGETTIYSYDEIPLAKTTFTQPLDSLWLEDRYLKHSVTDITSGDGDAGFRDILAISFSLPNSIYAKRI